jgi:hypothetical protein
VTTTAWRGAFLGLILASSVTFAHATIVIEQKKISVSQTLSGYVVVRGTEQPMDGATVEICEPGWKTVLASTKTNQAGYFSLENRGLKGVVYIRVSAPNMDIYQLRVRIQKNASPNIRVLLSVAT